MTVSHKQAFYETNHDQSIAYIPIVSKYLPNSQMFVQHKTPGNHVMAPTEFLMETR
jgi:hypothetical protein